MDKCMHYLIVSIFDIDPYNGARLAIGKFPSSYTHKISGISCPWFCKKCKDKNAI